MRSLLLRGLDVLFPSTCLVCRTDLHYSLPRSVCGCCLSRVEWLAAPPNIGEAYQFQFAGATYRGVMRELLHKFKFEGRDYLAGLLVDQMLRSLGISEPDGKVDGLVPIPGSFIKTFKRGFNPAGEIARILGHRWGIPVRDNILRRRLMSRSQTTLHQKDRHNNAETSFYLKPKSLPNQTYLLIDDICTTGATLEACARLIRGHGAKKVYAGVLAYDPLN